MSPLAPLLTAVHFSRRQPILWSVVLLVLFPSLLAGEILQGALFRREFLPVTILALLVTIGFHLWGQSCVLVMGRRIVHPQSGRGRRSLPILLRDARPLIPPLFLTDLLRQCLTLLWGILLILPGLLYSIRTALFDAVIAVEGQQYRPALQRSAFVVRHHFWQTVAVIIAIHLAFLLPAYLLEIPSYLLPDLFGRIPGWTVGILLAKNLLLAGGSALSLLTHIAFYHQLRGSGLASIAPAPARAEPSGQEAT